MALDVSALTDYVNQNKTDLLTKAIFGAKTIKKMVPQTGIKSSEDLHYLDTDATFQAGGTCGFNASGSTTLTKRNITVGKIRVMEALCPKDLEAKYTQIMLQEGSKYENMPFEQVYVDLKNRTIAKQLETAIWQGDTGSGNANLNKFDGLIKLIDAARTATTANAIVGTGTITAATNSTGVTGVGTAFTTEVAVGDKLYAGGVLIGTVSSITNNTAIVLTGNASNAASGVAFKIVPTTAANFASPILASAGITESNVRAIIKSIWKSIPAAVKGADDMEIFVGWDIYEHYIGALIEANLFTYTAGNDAQAAGELMIPGTQYKLSAVHGLDSTNRIFAIRTSNMYYGTDMMNEEEKYKLFFAVEADQIRYDVEWKSGCNVAFPAEIVQFTLA